MNLVTEILFTIINLTILIQLEEEKLSDFDNSWIIIISSACLILTHTYFLIKSLKTYFNQILEHTVLKNSDKESVKEYKKRVSFLRKK